MANIPAWAAELEEEWVESSPSSSHEPITLLETAESLPPITVNSIRAKRGSLRALGHAAPRGLPPSRSTSAKIISGHGEGRILSERFENLSIEGVWSPPSSRSSSGLAGEVAGTFVVKKGVEDDRGKALARKGRDMFGPTALEKMFQPPSPPQPPQPQHAVPDDARRSSHPYAPANPSRLSMSVTPSTALSMTTSEVPTRLGGDEDSVLREDTVVREDVSGVPQQDFSFSYPAPHIAAGSTGTRSESGSGTVRGGSSRSKAPFQPSLDPLEDGEPSNSTIHDRPHRRKHPRNASSPRAGSSIPGLRLFRSTYDTYTRDHLSALVDSIAIEPSPSPPSMPDAQNLRDWFPSASLSGSGDGTGSGSSEGSDLRSSKRLRMSPVTPGRQEGGVRDWGAQRRAVYDRIRGREVERTASASLNGDHDDGRSFIEFGDRY